MSSYKTLGEQRAQLRGRLGFAAAGAAAGVIQLTLNSFLQEAQVLLYWSHEWVRLRKYTDVTIGVDQYLTDYPATANPERIKAISILRGNVWSKPLDKGITPQHYTTQSMKSWPARWEPYEQIETWPKSNAVYTARIFFIKNLDPFDSDDERSTIDHDLIFKLAIANGKAHYRHPDAALYAKQAETLLISLKAKSWGKDKFSPYDYRDDPMALPVVV